MYNETFIKLWEGTIYNHVWRDDYVAWKIFEYLLISAYRGKPQGTTVKTTQQIVDVCFGASGKNGTIFKAIKRLEKYEMVKTKSTNRNTEFKIVNWHKYQGNGSLGKNEVKTKSKPSKTLIRIKNKELRNNTYSEAELLKVINQTLKREFRVLPRGCKKTLDLFTLQEIEIALTNLAADAWHGPKIKQLKLDYLLRPTTIDKFRLKEAVQVGESSHQKLNMETGKMEEVHV